MKKAKTVASVSFLDNHSISMDVELVHGISLGTPMKIDDDQWFCELIVRSGNGTLAIQMLADTPERFNISIPNATDEAD